MIIHDRFTLKEKILYSLSFAFIAVTMLSLHYHKHLIVFLIPVLIFTAWTAFHHLDKLLLTCSFLTPLSVNFGDIGLGVGISLPGEALMFGIMLVLLFNLLTGASIDKRLLYHPVTLVIGLQLVWMVITTVTSTMLIVSLKSTIARITFVLVYYILAAHLFSKIENIRKFLWLYIISLSLVIGYALNGWVVGGMTKNAAHSSMSPFYSDHTVYAAVISLLIFPLITFITDKEYQSVWRTISFLILLWLVIGLLTSYSRAAWVSAVAGILFSVVFFLRIRTWLVWVVALSVVGFVIFSWTDIIVKLESNTEDSSSDYREHIQSISNISTDASNVERINRWLCAIRMFNEKKVVGFGPGTYQFQYAPFQHFDERTIISTNFGEVGSSHSEYLGPLSEEGLPGMLLVIAIIITVVVNASRFIIRTANKQARRLAIGLLIGLSTYWVHGLMNYFLDTDNASVLYWSFIAALTALEINQDKSSQTISSSEKES